MYAKSELGLTPATRSIMIDKEWLNHVWAEKQFDPIRKIVKLEVEREKKCQLTRF